MLQRGTWERRRRGFTLVELMTVLVIIGLIAGIILPRFWAASDRTKYTACGQNLKTLATALTTYANEHGQVYPTALTSLVPKYIGTLPTCPEAGGIDTYASSYAKNDLPPTFTIFCRGTFHLGTQGVSANEPIYTLDRGLGP